MRLKERCTYYLFCFQVRKAFGIPTSYGIPCIVAAGYPSMKHRFNGRPNPEQVISENKFGKYLIFSVHVFLQLFESEKQGIFYIEYNFWVLFS